MAGATRYLFVREGAWRLWVLPERWSAGLWAEIRRRIADGAPAGHPLTQRFSFPAGDGGAALFLKLYGRSGLAGSLKDLARDSKAFRALKQGEALASCGFSVPLAVGAGEERQAGMLRRAFLVTAEIEGRLLPYYVAARYGRPLQPVLVRRKRAELRLLAREVRRLHRSGFVHGDLVPYNILVSEEGGAVRLYYLDNDRTRRYPAWLPQALWQRNLVQLNRFVLPGITPRDRLRFLCAYLGKNSLGRRERRLALRLAARTGKRSPEPASQGSQGGFRRLVRWGGPAAKRSER